MAQAYRIHTVAMGSIPQTPVIVTKDNLDWWLNLNLSAYERVVRVEVLHATH